MNLLDLDTPALNLDRLATEGHSGGVTVSTLKQAEWPRVNAW